MTFSTASNLCTPCKTMCLFSCRCRAQPPFVGQRHSSRSRYGRARNRSQRCQVISHDGPVWLPIKSSADNSHNIAVPWIISGVQIRAWPLAANDAGDFQILFSPTIWLQRCATRASPWQQLRGQMPVKSTRFSGSPPGLGLKSTPRTSNLEPPRGGSKALPPPSPTPYHNHLEGV